MLGKFKTAVHELRKFRDTATVDQILIEGDRMYFNALQNQNIPDTERRSLNYLPNQARWNFNRPLKSQNHLSKQTQSPFEANNSRQLPVEASNSRQSSVETNVSTHSRADVHKSNQSANESPVTLRNTDLPIVVEPVEAKTNDNENMLWLLKYQECNRVYTMTKT